MRPEPRCCSPSRSNDDAGQPASNDSSLSRCVAIVVCYNTADQTRRVIDKFPEDTVFDVLFVNDGSTDGTREVLDESRFEVVHHESNRGVGAAIRTGLQCAMERGYEAAAVLAGNNKDDPRQIPDVLTPIVAGSADYVQGSRFLDGGGHENLPRFRHIMVKVHALLFRILTGFRGTDALNGFRGFRLSVFEASGGIDIWQDWLDRYEFETYVHYKILKEPRLRSVEVGVTKTYPDQERSRGKVKYSHIRPVVDWWIILRPLVYLVLGLRS